MRATITFVSLLLTLTAIQPLLAVANPQVTTRDQRHGSNRGNNSGEPLRLRAPERKDRENLGCASPQYSKNPECQGLAANQRIADANIAVAKYTLVLIIVGIVQALALIFTLVATFKAANTAKESADAA